MSDLALHDRRHNDVRPAVVETKFDDHLRDCGSARAAAEKASQVVDRRLARIEMGILAAWGTGTLLGLGVIGFLIKIVLHLPT